MRPRAPKVCADPLCPHSQPCPIHHRKPWQRPADKPQRLTGRRATKRREYVLRRDGLTCQVCGEVRLADEMVADHEIPLAEGGPDAVSNLRAVCRECHSEKTAEEARRGRERWQP